MTVSIEPRGLALASLSDELSAMAGRVAASVVGVRGSANSSGSGVLWDRPGLVITNHHVVPGERAEVRLLDGTRLAAHVSARAERLDLVALRLEGALPSVGPRPAVVGDSSALRLGELVLAVGNPLGERNALTIGIVSGTSSPARAGTPRDVLQLAITLRPGNSGGALTDARGRVVGIPHMVTGAGLALAIPSRVVELFLSGAYAESEDGVLWV
jgi:serine protease Do